jgi:hypothetical protein
MKRSNLTIALYLFLVFAGGVSVGAFGHRLYTVKSVDASSVTKRKGPDEFRRAYMDEAKQRLQLSDSQSVAVEAILDKTREKYRAFRERTRPEMDQIQNEQIQAIRALLNESQRTEYEKWRAERAERRKSGGRN